MRETHIAFPSLIRFVLMSDELDHPISSKLEKIKTFKLDKVNDIINTLEYKGIDIESCKMVIQSIKIPNKDGEYYTHKMDMEPKKLFGEDHMEALDYVGCFEKLDYYLCLHITYLCFCSCLVMLG